MIKKSVKKAISILILIFINNAFSFEVIPPINAEERVIYGDTDDRIPPALYNFTDKMLSASHATAALISTRNIEKIGDEYAVFGETLEEKHDVCSNEQFSNQLAVADCSGVLVAPSLLLTASHCVLGNIEKFCKHNRWVFNYKESQSYQLSNQVYGCTGVLENVYNRKLGVDYALVALDEYVEDIKPVKINFSKVLPKESDLVMFGHPAGLPQKVTINATYREIEKYYALINFDSFSGNSGSPIINSKTGLLEGLLVAGEKDFVYDKKSKCKRAKRCKINGCSGEQVTLSRALGNIKKYISD